MENSYSSVTPERDQGIELCRPIVTTYKKDANSWGRLYKNVVKVNYS